MIQDVLRTLATIGMCSRRREQMTEKKHTADEKKHSKAPLVSASFMHESLDKSCSDSDDNTGASTTSYEPRTDPAVGSSDGSFDGSDASDLEVEAAWAEQRLKSMTLPVPPGFKPPPGLDFANFCPDNLLLPTQKTSKTRLNSRAAPFVSAPGTRLNSSAAPFMPKGQAPASDSQSAFIGASQHLQETLVQLKQALAEWEVSMPKSDGQNIGTSVAATANFAIGAAAAAMDAVPYQAKPNLTSMMVPEPLQNVAMFPPSWSVDLHQSSQSSGDQFNGWSLANKQVPVPVSIADCLSTQTLCDHLRSLDTMDPSLIVIVRRIGRLGLESPTWLRAHFSKFGVVDQVLVAHSRSNAYGKAHARIRPAGLGFIVMSTAAEVQTILGAGPEHIINEVVITVQQYKKSVDEDASQEAPTVEMRFQ
mmetsp:Transcript_131367/g.238933  ORF Transcript_131367/g.238933 Transcript_131367/m.238933 type:complete len:420 (-) Transcript_131367:241-1500(-)